MKSITPIFLAGVHFMQSLKSLLNQSEGPERSHFPVLAGNSIVALALRQMVRLAASVFDPLVVSGPEGSGKSAIAHAVHMLSALSDTDFLSFDCTNISDKDRSKIFATGLQWPSDSFQGTIFLNEIGLLPFDLQIALYNWLDWNQEQHRAVRLIAASSHALDGLVAKGQFDNELYNRLQKLSIPTQPLIRRRKDISGLMLAIWANNHINLPPSLNRAAWQLLEAHDWPGNFVELQRVAQFMAYTHGGKKISAEQVQNMLALRSLRTAIRGNGASQDKRLSTQNLQSHLAREEAMFLIAALERSGGTVHRAAKLAGIDATAFRTKLHQYGIAASDAG
jgi:DNA-binding NtrC family response regulator